MDTKVQCLLKSSDSDPAIIRKQDLLLITYSFVTMTVWQYEVRFHEI